MGRSVRLAFLGDSIIQRPICFYDLIGRVANRLPELQILPINVVATAQTIYWIEKTQLTYVLTLNPDIILLYWDSDVTDAPKEMSRVAHWQQFNDALQQFMKRCIAANIPVAVGGPGILGEGPIMQRSDFKSMQGDLDFMRNAIRAVLSNATYTLSSGVKVQAPYMDVRSDFCRKLSSSWKKAGYYKCMLTEDGEHANSGGTDIMADRFTATVRQLLQWKLLGNKTSYNITLNANTPVFNFTTDYTHGGECPRSFASRALTGTCSFQASVFFSSLTLLVLVICFGAVRHSYHKYKRSRNSSIEVAIEMSPSLMFDPLAGAGKRNENRKNGDGDYKKIPPAPADQDRSRNHITRVHELDVSKSGLLTPLL